MNQHPMMRLHDPDARARRQAIREQLTTKVKALAIEDEKLNHDIEELGLGKLIGGKVKKFFGKDDKKTSFNEKVHPRGKDGRFAEAPNASKEEKDYNEDEFKKWSETIAQIDAETKQLKDEEKKLKTDPNSRPLSDEYLDKRVDLDEKIKANNKKRKRLYDKGSKRYSQPVPLTPKPSSSGKKLPYIP